MEKGEKCFIIFFLLLKSFASICAVLGNVNGTKGIKRKGREKKKSSYTRSPGMRIETHVWPRVDKRPDLHDIHKRAKSRKKWKNTKGVERREKKIIVDITFSFFFSCCVRYKSRSFSSLISNSIQ